MGALPQWEMPRCAGATGLSAPAPARAPRSGITLRVAAGGDGKRLGSAGTSRERLSRESPLRLPAHAFVCEPRRSGPGGTALLGRPRCAPLSPGPRPEKLRGDATRAGPWEGGGERARGLLTPRPTGPASRRSRGKRAWRGGKKKNSTGRRVYKKQPTKRRFWQISISLLFPAPAAMPPSRLPCLRAGPGLGPRCREAARRVDPHPSPGERGQVCR